VGEHGDRGGRINPAELGERRLGPLRDYLDRIGEALRRGKARPWVDHVGAPAGHAGESAHGRGDVDRPAQDQARIGGDDVVEQLAAALGGLGPDQLRGSRGRRLVTLGRAERAGAVPVEVDEQLRPGVLALQHRDLDGTLAGAGQALELAPLVR